MGWEKAPKTTEKWWGKTELYTKEEVAYWGHYLDVCPGQDYSSVIIRLAEKVKDLEEKCE